VAGGSHARGVLNAVLLQPRERAARGLVTAGGSGNHGATVAYAGWLLGFPSIIYVPRRAAVPEILDRLEHMNARVVISGRTWDEAYSIASRRSQRDDMAFIHLFDDPSLIAGYSTLSFELLDSLPDLEVLVISASGGGAQLQGAAMVIKHLRPTIRIVGVQASCSPRRYERVRSGQAGPPHAARPYPWVGASRVAQANLDLVRRFVDDMVTVTCEDLDFALHALWSELEVGASVVGAGAVAAILAGKVRYPPGTKIAAVVGVMGSEGLF
jgi:threonine dehydratase